MEENDKIMIELTKKELEIAIKSVRSSSPILDDEEIQFKLYYKLLFKLNEKK